MKIHFIVNPISGKGKHNLTKEFLSTFFPNDIIEVDFSEYKKHAISLTQIAATKNPDIIVACGGDGTINEVASCLINTKIKLGIIPVGSGNGLASNLSISDNIEKAILVIQTGKSIAIDIGKINEHYFFSNMGLGIDALIIKKYEEKKRRNFSGYVNASLKASSQYLEPKAILEYDGEVVAINPFMLFISNSNEMGYNMSLTPNAKLSDGYLNLLYLPKINLFEKILFGTLVLTKKTEKFQKAKQCLIQHFKAEFPDNIFTDIQVDGEYHRLKTNKIEVSILPNSLQILTS